MNGRPRGRPRKYPLEEEHGDVIPDAEQEEGEEEVKTAQEIRDRRLRRAEEQGFPSLDDVYVNVRCTNCNDPMWTRNPTKEDLCEECAYFLRQEVGLAEMRRMTTESSKPWNPFL